MKSTLSVRARVAAALLLFALLSSFAGNATPLMRYYGGKVVSNARVVEVNWTSAVSSQVQTGMPGFYAAVLDSPYMDWLSEYSTVGVNGAADGLAGSNQRIGRGSFVAAVTITPSVTSKTVTVAQIEAELTAQLAAGNLPPLETDAAGNVNTVYMVDFPAGYTIDASGNLSCSTFCGIYDAIKVGGKSVGIGLIPDVTSGGCASGCGGNANPFDNVTEVHAHELVQIVTDLEVVFASNVARPIGWYSSGSVGDTGNIADVCNQKQATVAGMVVEKAWSQRLGQCIASSSTALPICDGSTTLCRECKAADVGQTGGCTGARAACATDVADVAYGECVACTAAADCSGATPVCAKGGTANDTCRGCTADAECSGNAAGPHCLGTGACGAAAPDAGTPDGGSDAGTPDAGGSDAGTPDAGGSDAGTSPADAGTNSGSGSGSGGGGCTSAGAAPMGLLALALAALGRRRRPRPAAR